MNSVGNKCLLHSAAFLCHRMSSQGGHSISLCLVLYVSPTVGRNYNLGYIGIFLWKLYYLTFHILWLKFKGFSDPSGFFFFFAFMSMCLNDFFNLLLIHLKLSLF